MISDIEVLYLHRIELTCKRLGLVFEGFCSPNKDKGKTKCKLYCKEHDYRWESTNISNFLHKGLSNCKVCIKNRRVPNKPLTSVEDTYYTRINELSRELGILFLGFLPRRKHITQTRCKLFCKKHGDYWETTSICNLLHRKRNPCPSCVVDLRGNLIREPEDDLKNRVISACEEYGTDFLDWSGDYKGILSKIDHRCTRHGIISRGINIRPLLNRKAKTSSCPSCHKEQFNKSIADNTEKHISQFESLGVFPEGTTFARNRERTTKSGVFNYWDVYCPVCQEHNISFIGSLKSGNLPCNCGKLTNLLGFYPKRSDWEDTLYLLLYESDEGVWYKIGRSFDIGKRISNLKGSYQEISLVSTATGTHRTVYETEQYLHEILKEYKHKPNVWFGGAGECFSIEILSNPEVICTFKLKEVE